MQLLIRGGAKSFAPQITVVLTGKMRDTVRPTGEDLGA